MAYSSCNVLRLENVRDDGSKKAGLAVRITEHFDDALSAILIGNNLANIGASSLASVLVILITSSEDYAWVSTVVLTFLVIIFGETIPKITAKKNANRIALRHAYPVRFMMIILKPLIWVVVKLIELITKVCPTRRTRVATKPSRSSSPSSRLPRMRMSLTRISPSSFRPR